MPTEEGKVRSSSLRWWIVAACLVGATAALIVWKTRRSSLPQQPPSETEGVLDFKGWDIDAATHYLDGDLKPPYPGLTPEQIRAVEANKSKKSVRLLNVPKAYDKLLLKRATTPGPDGLTPAGRWFTNLPPEEKAKWIEKYLALKSGKGK